MIINSPEIEYTFTVVKIFKSKCMFIHTKSPILLPRLKRILTELGENIKLARLRRKLSAEQVAERSGIRSIKGDKQRNRC